MASLPQIRQNSGATESELGAALFFMAVSALPAMYLAGRLLDRLGRPVAAAAALLLIVVTPLPSVARSVPELAVALLLFGLGAGAFEVVVVCLASGIEVQSEKRILNRAHALFSAGLLTGTLVVAGFAVLGVSAWIPLTFFPASIALGIPAAFRRVPQKLGDRPKARNWKLADRSVLALGLLAALSWFVESGVQQWSSVFMRDAVRASVGLSGLAPGIFACGMVIGRLGGDWLSAKISDRLMLALSGALMVVGVILLVTAQRPGVALAFVAFIGMAASAVAPTIYGLAGRRAAPEHRGAVVGATASVAYTGLLTGPVVVGLMAGLSQLRVAIGALAILPLLVCLAALRMPRNSLGER
jgi:MFS family permease